MIREFDFSGFGLRLLGDDPLLVELDELWAAFAGRVPDPVLEVRVERGEGSIPAGNALDADLEDRPAAAGRRLARVEGAIEVHGGQAVLRVHDGAPGRRLWGGINLMAQALGRALPARGGLLVHGAAAVVEGRAFLLTGASGTGKTTWARACSAAGLPVLSDDVVLLHVSPDRPCALGSPLRARDFPPPGRGRWPLAALLLARHGPPALAAAPRLRTGAVLHANTLFASGADPLVGELLHHLMARIPAHELSFDPDPSFVPLLRAFGGAAR